LAKDGWQDRKSDIAIAKSILPFEGTIFGLKIFNKALKELEIVELFNSQPLFLEY